MASDRPADGPDGGYPHGPAWSAGFRRAAAADLAGWLDLALGICDEADAIARRSFRRAVPTTTKPDRTYVTEADTEIERMIRARLQEAHPDHGLVGEEYGTQDGEARIRWIIDPIDGTHNFMRGVPLFGTLLAVQVDGEVQVGVMSAPALGERWFAARGAGAWAAGSAGTVAVAGSERRAIGVSSVATVEDGQLLFGSRRENVATGRMPGFDALVARSWRDRGFGDFWGYALVAEGAAEAMIETGLKIWDAAAPLVIVEEAGGRATDVAGARRLDGGTFVASNGRLHGEILRSLAVAPDR
jgi:histidinol-phosphatase